MTHKLFSLMGQNKSPQCQTFLVLPSLWGHLVSTMLGLPGSPLTALKPQILDWQPYSAAVWKWPLFSEKKKAWLWS